MVYYKLIMDAHKSKQFLGFVIRHTFDSILLTFDISILNFVNQIFTPDDLELIKYYETIDGVHRYDYNNDEIILIEYRLFGYMVSGIENDNSVVISLQLLEQ
jgi:hypothetical protein